MVKKLATLQITAFAAAVAVVLPYASALTVTLLIAIATVTVIITAYITFKSTDHNSNNSVSTAVSDLSSIAFEQSPTAIAVISPDGVLKHGNKALCRLIGKPQSELNRLDWQQLLPLSEHQKVQQIWQHLLEGKSAQLTNELQFISLSSGTRWGRVQFQLVDDDQKQTQYIIANIEDIEDEYAAIKVQRQWEQKFEQLLMPWHDLSASWIVDPNSGELEFFCPGFTGLFGPIKPNATLEHVIAHIHRDDQEKARAILLSSNSKSWQTEFRVIDQQQSLKYMLARGSTVINQFGQPQAYVGSAFDITEQVLQKQQLDTSVRRLNQSLSKLKYAYRKLNDNARLDSLTGLYNRKALYKELNKELKLYRRSPRNACLVFIDINDFKEINDKHGHLVGDKVLQALGQHLKQHCRETDVVGRFGGDEIALLLRESNLRQAQQFHQSVLAPGININVGSQRILLTVSCGFVELNESIENVEHWLAQADEQMYDNKNRYKSNKKAASLE